MSNASNKNSSWDCEIFCVILSEASEKSLTIAPINQKLLDSSPFPLAPWRGRAYRGWDVMRCTLLMIFGLIFLCSCEHKKQVVVTETRTLTARDASPKLFATSDERFRNAKPSPVRGETPNGWLALPATELRLLNYRFGESGAGEVWVSISSGTVIDNVNRWLNKQFGAAAIDGVGLKKLRTVSLAGDAGVWVEASGEYQPGMGAPAKSGFALAGVIAEINGKILTVKMVGPLGEVEQQHASLESFAKNLKWVD